MPDITPNAYERFKASAAEIFGHRLPGPIGASWNDLSPEQRLNWLQLAHIVPETRRKQTRSDWHQLPQRTRERLTEIIKTTARRATAILGSE